MDTEIIYQKKFPKSEKPDIETLDADVPDEMPHISFEKLKLTF